MVNCWHQSGDQGEAHVSGIPLSALPGTRGKRVALGRAWEHQAGEAIDWTLLDAWPSGTWYSLAEMADLGGFGSGGEWSR